MKYLISIAVFLTMMAAGVGLYFFIYQGYYPVAAIGTNLISAKDFNKNYLASVNYSRAVLSAYGKDLKDFDGEASIKEIKKGVLSKLIENELIYAEADKQIGKDLNRLAVERIDKLLASSSIDEAVTEKIYGLKMDDFMEVVMYPEAYREILEEKFVSDGKNFDEWFSGIKEKAKIFVLMSGFSWKNGEIVLK
ncbi:MAG: SurA N-terminal domain-containing protein [Candidatus Pacebacteria bacterium]|nr:SurA N-terminal domain-containing protein [Candidatus Paceibacterota bacterium]